MISETGGSNYMIESYDIWQHMFRVYVTYFQIKHFLYLAVKIEKYKSPVACFPQAKELECVRFFEIRFLFSLKKIRSYKCLNTFYQMKL